MKRTIWFVLILCAVSFNALGQNVVLGVLEDNPGHYIGEPNFRTVRVVFQKKGADWKPFQSNCPDQSCLKTVAANYPREIAWTIGFEGKELGKVTSRTPSKFRWYASVGQQEITSQYPTPKVGKRSSRFGGFTEDSVYRPLAANSQPYFRDPELWKPSQLANDVLEIVRDQFQKKFPDVTNCANPNENVAKSWHYRHEDIKVLKSYSSKDHWSIAQLELGPSRCDGPADDAFINQWFVISPAQEAKFLDSGIWLIDVGDYDNDGKSELLFSINRYNRGGYELFYADFSKSCAFEFSYH